MITKQLKNLKNLVFVSFAAFFALAFLFTPSVSKAQTTSVVPCDFTSGNLETGVVNEDVRCLQKYLNSNGYKIADIGVGSPGHETPMFGSLTEEAVKAWQAAHGVSQTGIFGPLSKIEYQKHIASLLSNQLSSLNNSPSGTPPILSVPPVTVAPPVQAEDSSEEKDARKKLLAAHSTWEDAQDDVDDADADEIDIENAQGDIDDAEEDLFKAFLAFVEKDYKEAADKADDVIESMGDILDEIHGDDEDAQKAIDDAQEAIDDASNEIDDADDDGEHVDEAKDLLEDAENKLDDAERSFKHEDFDEAEQLAKQAENLAEDAIDAIGE